MKKRFKHNLSHRRCTTHAIGKVIPLSWYYGNPGDSIRQEGQGLVRLNPLNGPFYGKLSYNTYTFVVPIRLLWTNFETFITGGATGVSGVTHPTITSSVTVGSLADQLRVPPKYDGTAASRTYNALPTRAYQTICNVYFKRKDIDTPAPVSLGDGADTTTSTSIQLANWLKDWLVTATTSPQTGTASSVPVVGTASMTIPAGGIKVTDVYDGSTHKGTIQNATGDDQTLQNSAANLTPGNNLTLENGASATFTPTLSGLEINIEDLRVASAQQRFMEARAMYGYQYPDYLDFLGVSSSDARLRVPEYVGGSSTPVQVSEVLQTAGTTAAPNGVGAFTGHGIAGHVQRGWLRYCEEHSIVMTVAVCRPTALYSNGLDRPQLYATKDDYWQPENEFLGQQPVYNQEVFADQVGSGGPTGIIGFNNRYYDWMHVVDSIGGAFRTTLSYMTTSRQFTSDVALNSSLIDCSPTEMEKLFQDEADVDNQLWVNFKFITVARRLIRNNARPMLK